MSASSNACVFCNEDGGEVIWSNALARVVRVDDADHPAFCRVIAQRHVREMTDLDEAQRAQMMRIVFAVEQAQRKLLSPQKVNLARLTFCGLRMCTGMSYRDLWAIRTIRIRSGENTPAAPRSRCRISIGSALSKNCRHG